MLFSIDPWLEEDVPQVARPECQKRLREVCTLLMDRKVQFLIGAGMSKVSGMPLAKELTTRMVSELLEGTPNSRSPAVARLSGTLSLELVAEAHQQDMDAPRFRQLLQQELAADRGQEVASIGV